MTRGHENVRRTLAIARADRNLLMNHDIPLRTNCLPLDEAPQIQIFFNRLPSFSSWRMAYAIGRKFNIAQLAQHRKKRRMASIRVG